MCRSSSLIVAKRHTRLAVLPVVLPVAGCTVATVALPEETTGDASPPSRVRLVAHVGGLNDRSFNLSVWQGIPATAKTLGPTADKDSRCVETTDSEDQTQHSGKFNNSGCDVIVPVGLALGDTTVAASPKHPNVGFIGIDQFREDQAGFRDHADSASPELPQLLTELRGGIDSDMLATGHEQ